MSKLFFLFLALGIAVSILLFIADFAQARGHGSYRISPPQLL